MSIVLIVEDEPIEQEFLTSIVVDELISEENILACESGVQAVALAKKYRPDIIIMDVLIPELDGLSAIEEIRQFLPDVCVVILTAYSDFSFAQRAISLRVCEYLLKPVKPKDFRELLQRLLTTVSAPTTIAPKAVAASKKKEPEQSQHPFIEEAVEYIKTHYRERLTLETVASKVFVNPKYFSHIFKKEVGVAFTEYVIRLRIQYACQLLETTNYPAYRISFECGFSDPSYFNRVFCAQMNMTPQSYRKHVGTEKRD